MLFDLIGSLSPGEQIATAGSVAVVAFYLWRAGAIVSLIVGLAASASRMLMVALVLLAMMIGAGWLDPLSGQMITDLLALRGWFVSVPGDIVGELIERLLGVI